MLGNKVQEDLAEVNLALQGGGSHGAFTWGVLDRLLEEEWIKIEGISGVSAGAMNAVMVAQGLIEDGHQGARAKLDQYWNRVAIKAPDFNDVPKFMTEIGSFIGSHISQCFGNNLDVFNVISGIELNPLQAIVDELVDFELIQKKSELKLFIGATQARTGKLKLFTNSEISTKVIMASACLPSAVQTGVEIDGEVYWDGGYSANPAIYPLIYQCDCEDVITILLHPLERTAAPGNPADIMERIAELGFSNTFLREMRAITIAKEQINSQKPMEQFEQKIFNSKFHFVEAERLMNELSASTKMNNLGGFLEMLKNHGRAQAEIFIENNKDKIGKQSSVDLEQMFN